MTGLFERAVMFELHSRKRVFIKFIFVFVFSVLLICGTSGSDVKKELFHMDSAMIIPTSHNYLTIRKGPGFTYPIMYSLDSVSALTVVEKGIWYKVLYNGVYGYVYSTTFVDSEAFEPDRLKGYSIGIDADGQMNLDRKSEFIAPQSKVLTERMNERHQGVYSGTYDYEINLKVAMKLKSALELEGATVVMPRQRSDHSMSNRERADYLNKYDCNLVISISCDSSNNPMDNGVQVYIPRFTTSESTKVFAETLLNKLSNGLGVPKSGVKVANDITFLNWSKGNVVKVEIGYLSNREDERKLTDESYQLLYANYIKESIVEVLLQKNQE